MRNQSDPHPWHQTRLGSTRSEKISVLWHFVQTSGGAGTTCWLTPASRTIRPFRTAPLGLSTTCENLSSARRSARTRASVASVTAIAAPPRGPRGPGSRPPAARPQSDPSARPPLRPQGSAASGRPAATAPSAAPPAGADPWGRGLVLLQPSPTGRTCPRPHHRHRPSRHSHFGGRSTHEHVASLQRHVPAVWSK